MIVVSDTTAITTLLKAGEERLLSELFGNVIIPKAVLNELMAFHSRLPDFISVRPLETSNRLPPSTQTLGRGEAEAIALAKQINADLLLTDDLKARGIAIELGLNCTGLVGLIVRAKQNRHITSAMEVITALEKDGGLYLSDSVKVEALKLAGEIS
jgi:predicted nucleic acid-binding protein